MVAADGDDVERRQRLLSDGIRLPRFESSSDLVGLDEIFAARRTTFTLAKPARFDISRRDPAFVGRIRSPAPFTYTDLS